MAIRIFIRHSSSLIRHYIGSFTNHCCPGKSQSAKLVNEPMGQFANEQQTPNYKQQTEFQQ